MRARALALTAGNFVFLAHVDELHKVVCAIEKRCVYIYMDEPLSSSKALACIIETLHASGER